MREAYDIIINNKLFQIAIEPLAECSMCHRLHNLTPSDITPTLYQNDEVGVLFTYLCPSCEDLFYVRYNAEIQGNILTEITFDYAFPIEPKFNDFESEIHELSPNFIEIYGQAYKAELEGLSHIYGAGYGKALEFLIKDYLIVFKENPASEIKPKYLKDCIRMIEDEKIQTLLRGASWLRNDETHYERRNSDYDTNTLKSFIKAIASYIATEIKFRQAQEFTSHQNCAH